MNIISTVRPVSNSHYNQSSSPSLETELVSTDGYKIISSLTLYVPERIDIDRILAGQPPDFSYHRDYFLYILHLITSIPSRKRDLIEKNDGFTPINRKFLQKRLHGYRRYIEYLKEVGLVQERSYYKPSETSRGLKFTPRYNSVVKPVTITKWTLIKSIIYLHKTYNTEITEELSYLRNYFNDDIEVDYENGVAYLNQLYAEEVTNSEVTNELLRYNSRLLPLTRLKDKNYSFHADNKGYRLHTNITQMMSGLRRFITYQGKKLCAIDIKNSQLYLAITLLDDELFTSNNISSKLINPILLTNPLFPNMVVDFIRNIKTEPDVLLFKEWVSSGFFYERFGEKLFERGILENLPEQESREAAKKITFSSIYSPNNLLSNNEAMQLFKVIFPNVFEVFKLIKRGHKNHPTLSVCLQRLEAELVLHKACKTIFEERPDVFMVTLHDSIITTEDNVEYVQSVLYNILRTNIGVPPNLKIERWE
ncbi:hypothetical protein FUA48_05785 [Flavobacterium alkalisoli]|uniref:DNA-directed DNA polymerase family A palm domain-containing protein n=1 Tax=Flavobacterium alkalisoli TaxID=2602769 RepID=A0A5B9FWR0_9FLAO|nr:hypothetical protein [Flavobacterium alkalisoli]QEE49107.1 hypothetical protein FUA48_05785 [Flavobacterium alkalisoli]